MTTDQDTQDEPSSRPSDIHSIISGDHSTAKIKSQFIHGLIEGCGNDDVEFGVQIHQDGQHIGLVAGTTWTAGDDPELYTSHGLTVEQAREIAEALEEAAREAENAAGVPAEAEKESFIRRLLP